MKDDVKLFDAGGQELEAPAELVPVAATPPNMLALIAQAVMDPRIDVEKMERLLAMHERITAEDRRKEFAAALSRLQAKLPQIEKHGRIIVKNVERSRFAKLEDIDLVVRPYLAEEGFAFSFDTETMADKSLSVTCKLSHANGHSETKTLLLPFDKSEYRSDVQSTASTVTYARRQLIKMHLNLIERDEDADGVTLEPISDDQAKDLAVLLKDIQADVPRFLKLMNINRIEDLRLKDYPRAMERIKERQAAIDRMKAQ